MIVWMLYSALVALVVAAAARAAESLGRLLGYQVRWIWMGAIVLTVYLSAAAGWRLVRPTAEMVNEESDIGATATSSAPLPMSRVRIPQLDSSKPSLIQRLASRRASLDDSWNAIGHRVPAAANTFAGAFAVALSLLLLGTLTVVASRFRTARRAWRRLSVQGVEVRVAPHAGPLVIGIVRSEIVIPEWLLTRDASDQRMVVTHEAEHLRARDPLLLVVGWTAIIVAPWNGALWYMLTRLRLAVELDCDARVMRRGAEAASYGALLIEVAEHASPLRPSALALAESSQLRQRILAMGRSVPRFALLRAGAAGVFTLALLLLAVTSTLPVQAQAVPPQGVPQRAPQGVPVVRSQSLWQSLDSMFQSLDSILAKQRRDSAAVEEEFPSVDVIRGWIQRYHPEVARVGSEVSIVVIAIDDQKRYVSSLADAGSQRRDSVAAGLAVLAMMGDMLLQTAKSRLTKPDRPLAIVDGDRVQNFDALTGDRVASSEFIDAKRAIELYGPDAVNGAQVITTQPSRAQENLMEFGLKDNAPRLRRLGLTADDIGDMMMLNVRPGVVGPRRTVITVVRVKKRG